MRFQPELGWLLGNDRVFPRLDKHARPSGDGACRGNRLDITDR
jgi:hypothetical protein